MARWVRSCWRRSAPSRACSRRASSEARRLRLKSVAKKKHKPGRAAARAAAGAAAPAAAAAAGSAGKPPPPQRADLEGVRGRIDAVDERIHALINERARLAQQVGISKAKDGHTVDFYRPEREAQVLRMARARNAGPLRDSEVLRLFREIMSACLAQQEPLKVAFL